MTQSTTTLYLLLTPRALSIITSPPPSDKYSTIKSFFLTSAYGLTDGERALALLNIRGLGDSKPSELMDNMLSLLGQHRPCFLFRQIFLQQLPEHVRTPLAVSDTSDYRALALEADKLFLASRSSKSHTSLDIPAQCNDTGSHVDATCWYHQKYGDKAKKCLPTCPKFKRKRDQGNARAGQQQHQRLLARVIHNFSLPMSTQGAVSW